MHHFIFHHWIQSYQSYPEYCLFTAKILFADLNRRRYRFLQRQKSLDSSDKQDRVAGQRKRAS